MDNDEIQSVLNEHHDMIVTLARGCFHRLRKPTFYEVADVVQEGKLKCIQRLPEFDPQKSSIKSYIYLCVMSRFTDMVTASWSQKKNDNSQNQMPTRIEADPASIARVHEFQKTLTEEELNFIRLNMHSSTYSKVCREMGITSRHRRQMQERIAKKLARTV
jgi:RNA polymerase sigma factor (sigma-70 family)